MGNKLLITKLNRNNTTYIATALYSEKQLLELYLEPTEQESILGNIYVGRVKDVVKNLNAAFIEIAPKKPCYYSLEDCRNPLYVKKINSPRMVQGDEVVVQVVKENIKTKPPKVSTNLTFSGTYLILTTENTSLGISRKLPEEERERLRKLLEPYKNDKFGLVVRTNAAKVEPSEILKEYERLKQEYEQLIQNAVHRTCFSCLRKSPPEFLAILKNLNSFELEEIITDDPKLWEQIKAEGFQATLYEDKLLSLSSLYSLEVRLQEALKERVWLKSGGYLVIQPTEALTVIDVNSGKSVAKKKVQEHYLNINLEAAEEIAHQLRLRNISGIIIVDFIDMKEQSAKEELMLQLKQFVKKDSVPVQVVDMTRLNLVELTRKKVRKSLTEQISK